MLIPLSLRSLDWPRWSSSLFGSCTSWFPSLTFLLHCSIPWCIWYCDDDACLPVNCVTLEVDSMVGMFLGFFDCLMGVYQILYSCVIALWLKSWPFVGKVWSCLSGDPCKTWIAKKDGNTLFGFTCLWRSSLITQSCLWHCVLAPSSCLHSVRDAEVLGFVSSVLPLVRDTKFRMDFPRYRPSQVQCWFRTWAQWSFRSAPLPMRNIANVCSIRLRSLAGLALQIVHVLIISCDSCTSNRIVLHL